MDKIFYFPGHYQGSKVADHGGAESLTALIISTTMPDGPAALSDFIFEMAKKMEKKNQ